MISFLPNSLIVLFTISLVCSMKDDSVTYKLSFDCIGLNFYQVFNFKLSAGSVIWRKFLWNTNLAFHLPWYDRANWKVYERANWKTETERLPCLFESSVFLPVSSGLWSNRLFKLLKTVYVETALIWSNTLSRSTVVLLRYGLGRFKMVSCT